MHSYVCRLSVVGAEFAFNFSFPRFSAVLCAFCFEFEIYICIDLPNALHSPRHIINMEETLYNKYNLHRYNTEI